TAPSMHRLKNGLREEGPQALAVSRGWGEALGQNDRILRASRSTERGSKEHQGMTLAFSGARTHDPEGGFVVYTVRLDGEEIECAIDDAVLGCLCNAFDDPIQIFDSCHMLILEYT